MKLFSLWKKDKAEGADKKRKDATFKDVVAAIGDLSDQNAPGGTSPDIFPISEAIDKEKRILDESLKVSQIGQTIPGKGVFIGIWEPKDREGRSLGTIFNLFAAPEDLTDVLGRKILPTFNEAVKRVASLKNWHGHDGGNFENDAALYKAIRKGKYNGEWFIPTRDIVGGPDDNGKKFGPDTLYDYKSKGDLKGTFTTEYDFGKQWYWSCTEGRRHGWSYKEWKKNSPSLVSSVNFEGGDHSWKSKDGVPLSCRPVRVEPRLV